MHAAFEVGVLTRILEELSQPDAGFELAGLSGTSAGALCALMVWYGLAPKNGKSGSAVEASNNLNHFWEHFVARTTSERLLNGLTRTAFKIEEAELPVLGLSAARIGLNPCGAIYKAVAACLPNVGVRREFFDLDYVLGQACIDFNGIDWRKVSTRLLIGATEVVNGYETVFDSDLNKLNHPGEIKDWHQRLPLSLDGVAASGTLPDFREAQHIKGCGHYWDGLYSQNPPVREFVEERFDPQKQDASTDELWILRINPQQWPRLCETHGEIEDRENELMGNLSLKKELDFVLKVNDWLERKDLPQFRKVASKKIAVRTIKMRKETVDELQLSSKFDRSLAFLDRLRLEGREVANDWLDRWNAGTVGKYPEDAGYERQ